jgi:hypothetical protein
MRQCIDAATDQMMQSGAGPQCMREGSPFTGRESKNRVLEKLVACDNSGYPPCASCPLFVTAQGRQRSGGNTGRAFLGRASMRTIEPGFRQPARLVASERLVRERRCGSSSSWNAPNACPVTHLSPSLAALLQRYPLRRPLAAPSIHPLPSWPPPLNPSNAIYGSV